MRATIHYPLAPTLNEIIEACKSGWYGKLKRRYTAECGATSLGCPSFPGRVWLHFHWHIGTLRRDPADNTPAAAKFVLDGLVKSGVLKEDNAEIIQQPVIHTWAKSKPEGLILTISDKPIYQLTKLEDSEHVVL